MPFRSPVEIFLLSVGDKQKDGLVGLFALILMRDLGSEVLLLEKEAEEKGRERNRERRGKEGRREIEREEGKEKKKQGRERRGEREKEVG